MEDLQKTILISILVINTKLTNKDISYVDDVNILLSNVLTSEENRSIYESIENTILNLTEKEFKFVEDTILKTNLDTKQYLFTVAKNIDVLKNIDKYNVPEYINTFLVAVYTNITPQQEFAIYQMIVKISIIHGDPILIKTVIDKIQTL